MKQVDEKKNTKTISKLRDILKVQNSFLNTAVTLLPWIDKIKRQVETYVR